MKNTNPAARTTAPAVANRRAFSRRNFLRGAGVALTLPMLDAMLPAFTSAAEQAARTAVGPDGKPGIKPGAKRDGGSTRLPSSSRNSSCLRTPDAISASSSASF